MKSLVMYQFPCKTLWEVTTPEVAKFLIDDAVKFRESIRVIIIDYPEEKKVEVH